MTTRYNKSDRILATGLLDPINEGLVSINGSNPARIDISGGCAQFADSFTNPILPDSAVIEFDAFINVELDNIATDIATFLYLDREGSLIQETELKVGEFLRDHVGLGIANHVNNTVVNSTSNFTPTSLSSSLMTFADLSGAMLPLTASFGGRNVITGNSGSLGLDKSDGTYFSHAINSRNSNKSPNLISSPALVKPPLFIGWTVTDNTSGDSTISLEVLSEVYDDGTAVEADGAPQGVLGEYEWTNHRVYGVADQPTILGVIIGQKKYSSKLAAHIGLASELLNVLPAFLGVPPLATLTMRGGSFDLSDINDVEIRQALSPRAEFV